MKRNNFTPLQFIAMETYINAKNQSLLVQIMNIVDGMTEEEQRHLWIQLQHHHPVLECRCAEEKRTRTLSEEEIAVLCRTAIQNNGC